MSFNPMDDLLPEPADEFPRWIEAIADVDPNFAAVSAPFSRLHLSMQPWAKW